MAEDNGEDSGWESLGEDEFDYDMVYEVEAILNKKLMHGHDWYLVKWLGYDEMT